MHIWLISFLIFSMLIGRKTLAYFQFGPFYWIELISFMALFFTILRLFILRQSSIPVSVITSKVTIAVFLYIALSVVLVVIFGFDEAKELILSFYIVYYLLFLFIFNVSSFKSLYSFRRFWIFIIPLIPLLIPVGKLLILALFGEVKMPGGTFIYPATFVISLLLVKNTILKYFLSLVSMVFIFLSFERASFVNLFFIFFVLSSVFIYNNQRNLLSRLWQSVFFMSILSLIMLVFIFPLFDSSGFRYSLNLGNFFEFIQSIFVTQSDYSGTRGHRIDMWLTVINKTFDSGPLSILFGHGFEGAVSDTSFRAIHNEYISIYYRTGLVGLALYVFFLMSIMLQSIRLMKYDQEVSIILLVILTSFSSDALTGTIITSPFLSIVAYTMFAYLSVWSYKLKKVLMYSRMD
jgi:hypothetical protein